jgi:hypothetical protein
MNTLCPATVARVSANITTSKLSLIFNLQHQFARPLSPQSRHKPADQTEEGRPSRPPLALCCAVPVLG